MPHHPRGPHDAVRVASSIVRAPRLGRGLAHPGRGSRLRMLSRVPVGGDARTKLRRLSVLAAARRWWPALVVALGVVAVDQVSKAIVRAAITPGERISVIDGVLRLVHARNSGIAGGLLAGQPLGLIIGVSLAAIIVLALVARMLGPGRWTWLPIGLILGGALGNLLDRVRAGAVTDFLVLGNGGPANLADQAITLGVIGLLIVAWRSPDQRLDGADTGGEQDGQHHAAA